MKEDFQHFVCIVASDKPFELADKYDKRKHGVRHLVYRHEDAEELKEKHALYYEELAKVETLTDMAKKYMKENADRIRKMDAESFYEGLCKGNGLEIDEETKDAYSNVNEDGKFSYIEIGNRFSMPLKLKDGTAVYQARKGDIDWRSIHLGNRRPYEVAWDTVMGGKKPKGEEEEKIYNNMKNRTTYFQKYGTRENYINANTAFWGYAFVSDDVPWTQLEDDEEQFEWVRKFYDRFIRPLPDDALITVMECRA